MNWLRQRIYLRTVARAWSRYVVLSDSSWEEYDRRRQANEAAVIALRPPDGWCERHGEVVELLVQVGAKLAAHSEYAGGAATSAAELELLVKRLQSTAARPVEKAYADQMAKLVLDLRRAHAETAELVDVAASAFVARLESMTDPRSGGDRHARLVACVREHDEACRQLHAAHHGGTREGAEVAARTWDEAARRLDSMYTELFGER